MASSLVHDAQVSPEMEIWILMVAAQVLDLLELFDAEGLSPHLSQEMLAQVAQKAKAVDAEALDDASPVTGIELDDVD